MRAVQISRVVVSRNDSRFYCKSEAREATLQLLPLQSTAQGISKRGLWENCTRML